MELAELVRVAALAATAVVTLTAARLALLFHLLAADSSTDAAGPG